jgi:hypothetical protein
VKQSDLGEYEENVREKKTIQVYQVKHQLSLKSRQNTSSPSNQIIWMATIKFRTHEGSNQSTRFLNAKDHTPPEPKAKQLKRQI